MGPILEQVVETVSDPLADQERPASHGLEGTEIHVIGGRLIQHHQGTIEGFAVRAAPHRNGIPSLQAFDQRDTLRIPLPVECSDEREWRIP